MEFVFNLEEAQSVQEVATFGVLDSNVYKNVEIIHASLSKTKGRNNTLDLSLKTEDGHELTIYQAFVLDPVWASGADNKYGYAKWLRFAKACGLKNQEVYKKALVKKDGTPVVKDGVPVVLNCLKGLTGCTVDLGIIKELDYHNSEVKEKNIIFDSFSAGSTNGDKLIGRLNDAKTDKYKAYLANAEDDNAVETEDVSDDLGI